MFAHNLVLKAIYLVVDFLETLLHLTLSHKSLDDAKSAEGFFHYSQHLARRSLTFARGVFEALANPAYHNRNERQYKERHASQFPTCINHITQEHDYLYRVFEQHIQTARNARPNFLNVRGKAAEDVALLRFRKIPQRQVQNLVINPPLELHHGAVADWRHKETAHIREEISEKRAKQNRPAEEQQCVKFAVLLAYQIHLIIEVIHKTPVTPLKFARVCHDTAVGIEQRIQKRDEHRETKQRKCRPQCVEDDIEKRIFLKRRKIAHNNCKTIHLYLY